MEKTFFTKFHKANNIFSLFKHLNDSVVYGLWLLSVIEDIEFVLEINRNNFSLRQKCVYSY